MDQPTLRGLVIGLSALLLGPLSAAAAEIRTWADTKGTTIEAEYVSSTAEAVMLRRADGLAMRWKLSDLSEADRTFVAQKQSAEKAANTIEAVIKGEVVWRLPAWNSLSWSNTQPAEIWLWDDKSRTATEKVATVKVDYTNNQRNRNQFEGAFKTDQAVSLPRNARLVVKAKFKTSVNGKDRELEEASAPMSLPALNKGEIKLPAVRVSITH